MLRMNAQQTALWNSGTGKFDHLSMKDISAEAAARNAKAKAEKDADKAEEKLKQAQKEAKKAAKKAKKASDKADKANQKAAAKAKKAEGAFAGAGGASEAIVAGAEELTRAEALKDETRPFPPELDNVRRIAETVLGIPETANLFYEAAHPEATKDGGKVH